MKKAWTVLMFVFSCAFAQAQPYAGGVYPVKMLINSNPNPAGTPTWIPWNGKIEPTVTPTSTPTWNATTTRTQPPTATATATNTPVMVQSEVRNVRQSENYSRSSYLIIPVLSPTPIVIPATTPGFYNKIELDVQTIGITWATLLFNSSTHNFGPFIPRNFYLFGDSNGPVTINISGNAEGVTTRVNVLSSVVRQGF
jgi:hypothetical protein